MVLPMARASRLSVMKISKTGVVAQIMGPVTPASTRVMLESRLDMLLWRIMTPLGLPVEPEVNSTLIRSPGATGTLLKLVSSWSEGRTTIPRSASGSAFAAASSDRIIFICAVSAI